MCGRFTQLTTWTALIDYFRLASPTQQEIRPSYNAAPTHAVSIIHVLRRDPDTKQWELVPMRKGLIPSRAKDLKIGNSLINARAETAATKPAFRSAMKQRRWPGRPSH
jgi:putative SOS response-associated peptidase YedK